MPPTSGGALIALDALHYVRHILSGCKIDGIGAMKLKSEFVKKS
jgi:uncharacterized Zn ribbon protein